MRPVRATNESVTDEVTALSHVFLPLLEAPTPPPSFSFLKPIPLCLSLGGLGPPAW
jgi:hypothetical protein